MRIILLATDELEQLAPLTGSTPAPLIPIVNRPVIGIALELLARAGNKHALVSLYNRSGSIASFVNTGRRWGMHIDFLSQREPLGSAGSLQWAGHLLDETFAVIPSSSILDIDIQAALAFHRAHGGLATAIVSPRPPAQPGQQAIDPQQFALPSRNTEHPPLYLTGAYLFEPSVLGLLPASTRGEIDAQLLPAIRRAGAQIHALPSDAYWNPLSTFQEYREAQRVFLLNAYHAADPASLGDTPRLRHPSVDGRQIAPGIWVGLNDAIHPTAQLAPPICIGDNCWLGREVEIGPEVVIGANAVIDEEATVERTTIFERTYVGRLLKLSGVVANRSTLIDTETAHSTEIVDSFLLSEIGVEGPDGFFRRLGNIALAALLLLLSLPIQFALAVLALLFHGRAIQRERRVGSQPPTLRNRQETGPYPFDMFTLAHTRADGSTSAFGRWLRTTQLAYLPALANVLRADCELVGVKPLRPDEAERIHESWQQKHYDRPAGLLGAWYVQTTPESDLDSVLVADAYYVSTCTWHGDILLMLHSAMAWMRRQFQRQHTPKSTLLSDTIQH
ncbi:nucleotidyl transferase [Chloroflexia bacterium SDU3-3]|nr:nucleotidyl transferase [Chloroflexia bacterium SDU3-3]